MEIRKTEGKKNKKWIVVGIGFLIIVVAVGVYSMSTQQKENMRISNDTAILFMTDTCSYCNLFIEDTLSNDTVWEKLAAKKLTIVMHGVSIDKIEEAHPRFKSCKIIVDKKEADPYWKGFGVRGVPTLVIVNSVSGGKVNFSRYEGYRNASDMLEILS